MENAEPERNTGRSTPPLKPLASIDWTADPRQTTEASGSVDVSSPPIDGAVAKPVADGETATDILRQDSARRKQVEDDLRKLGMSPVEIQRFTAANAHVADSGIVSSRPSSPSAAPKRPARPDAASLESYAAALLAAKTAERTRAVETAARNLPEFRESSPQERIQADGLLRDANMLRRRERYTDAEAKCRDAVALVPKDAAALELLGDICQGLAQIDPALAAYKRAMEADPKRSSVEKKYGDLLMRQQSWGGYNAEAVEKNPYFSVFLSAILPGAGQIHNGDYGKGAFFLVLDALCAYLLYWSPIGFQGKHAHEGIGAALLGCAVFAGCGYIMSVWDANVSAQRNRRKNR